MNKEQQLKRTPLFKIHQKLGARIIEFAGWEMPVQYTSIIAEHHNTRQRVSLFDICHMGEFIVQGERALGFLQYLLTNDVAKLEIGQCQYNLLCNHQGGILDDLILYRIDHTKYMLVVNAINQRKDWQWLKEHLFSATEIEDVSEQTVKIDLQGPLAYQVLKSTFPELPIEKINYFCFKEFTIGNIELAISRTGYTGELGYELYTTRHYGPILWEQLMEKGQKWGILPAGLGARDTLRLEMGYPLYGHELNEQITPLEASLQWAVAFHNKDFIGQQALLEQKEEGIKKKRIGFVLKQKAIPRAGNPIKIENKQVGWVTSGTFSPTLNQPIGLGYLAVDFLTSPEISIEIRNKLYPAQIFKYPFYRQGTVKKEL